MSAQSVSAGSGIAENPSANPAHRRIRPRLPGWLTVLLGVLVAGMALVAVMRLFFWDDSLLFAALNTVTPVVYLPAWFVAAAGLIWRRYVLAASALALVVIQILLMLPELTAAQPVPAWATDAPKIRLFDANVQQSNFQIKGYAHLIEAEHSQLLTMEEADPHDAAVLTQSGALRDMPYRYEVNRFDNEAFLIASAYPLSDENVIYFQQRPLVVRVTMHLSSGLETLWVLHTTELLTDSFAHWKAQLALINALLHHRGTKHLLVVGDFNATWQNKGFRQILSTGLADGAAARGDDFQVTWPINRHHLPPVVRIDHVLTGSGVTVTRIQAGPGPGSSHRSLHATIAFQR